MNKLRALLDEKRHLDQLIDLCELTIKNSTIKAEVDAAAIDLSKLQDNRKLLETLLAKPSEIN